MRKVLYIMGFLSDEDIEWMARAGRVIRPGSNEAVVVEGGAIDELFFVMEGECIVEIEGGGVVARLGVGEIFGEMAFVEAAPPSATVRAGPSCALLAINHRQIDDRIADVPGFSGRFYKALATFLADRLRATTRRIAGRGDQDPAASEPDELDDRVMAELSLAGLRFEHLSQRLSR